MATFQKDLFEKNLITKTQFEFIDAIDSGKRISVYNELRILLYLGIMLFTTGIGLLIYQNIGQIGHIISIILLFTVTIVCFAYIVIKQQPYSNKAVQHPVSYYDYILLLGSLLFIAVLGYLHYLFNFFGDHLEFMSLITALLFYYLAYRYDHLGILSLAITATFAFFGISVSPQKWYSLGFSGTHEWYFTGAILGAVLAAIAMILNKKEIKSHFAFTYLNFSAILFLPGTLMLMFIERYHFLYFSLLMAGCFFLVRFAHQLKSRLFILYVYLAAYIAITYEISLITGNFTIYFFIYIYPVITVLATIRLVFYYLNFFKHD